MLLNCKKTLSYISDWIRNESKKIARRPLIVHLDGSCESYVTSVLCKNSCVETICVITHKDNTQQYYTEHSQIINKLGIPSVFINISKSTDEATKEVETISKQVKTFQVGKNFATEYAEMFALSYFAECTEGLIVSNADRDSLKFYRFSEPFGILKYGGIFDLFPIADLFLSEIRQLLEFINKKHEIEELQPIINSTDKSMSEAEWADRENSLNKIIESDEDPVRHRDWARYTGQQRAVVAHLHQKEKLSRRIYNPNLLVCNIRQKENLVR